MSFSNESYRISANLEQQHAAMTEAEHELSTIPSYMTWKTVNKVRYLYVKKQDGGGESSLGRESEATAAIKTSYDKAKASAEDRVKSATKKLSETVAQYKALRLPTVMPTAARVLRGIEAAGLGDAFLVVGSCAFPAYEIEAGIRFSNAETEDFDVSWRLAPSISVSMNGSDHPLTGGGQSAAAERDRSTGLNGLYRALMAVDKSFQKSTFAGHKVRNKDLFEVDVLCQRGDIFKSDPSFRDRMIGGGIEPLEMDGQDILHFGKPITHTIIGSDGASAKMTVPDPRCMAIHKRWLSEKSDRSSLKRRKDAGQSAELMDALQNMHGYAMDEEFIDSLPPTWKFIAKDMVRAQAVMQSSGI